MDPKMQKAILLGAAARLAAAAVGPAAQVQVPNASGQMAPVPVSPDTAGQDPGLRGKELILANKTTDFYVWLLSALNDSSVFTDPPAAGGAVSPANPNISAAGLASLLGTIAKAAVVTAHPTVATAVGAAATALQQLAAGAQAAAQPASPAPSPLTSVAAGS